MRGSGWRAEESKGGERCKEVVLRERKKDGEEMDERGEGKEDLLYYFTHTLSFFLSFPSLLFSCLHLSPVYTKRARLSSFLTLTLPLPLGSSLPLLLLHSHPMDAPLELGQHRMLVMHLHTLLVFCSLVPASLTFNEKCRQEDIERL